MTSQPTQVLRAIFAITLTQPWATLMALGLKRIETRPWPTRYVGPTALYAATRFGTAYRDLCEQEPFRSALLQDPRLDPHRPFAPQLPRGRRRLAPRLTTEGATDAGFAHLHRMGQFLHLKSEWFRSRDPVPHYILYGEHKRGQTILLCVFLTTGHCSILFPMSWIGMRGRSSKDP